MPSVVKLDMVTADRLPACLVKLPLLAVQNACVVLTAVSQVASHKPWVITLLSTGVSPTAAHLSRGGSKYGMMNKGVHQLTHAT